MNPATMALLALAGSVPSYGRTDPRRVARPRTPMTLDAMRDAVKTLPEGEARTVYLALRKRERRAIRNLASLPFARAERAGAL